MPLSMRTINDAVTRVQQSLAEADNQDNRYEETMRFLDAIKELVTLHCRALTGTDVYEGGNKPPKP